jgi:hypothetical protein
MYWAGLVAPPETGSKHWDSRRGALGARAGPVAVEVNMSDEQVIVVRVGDVLCGVLVSTVRLHIPTK